MNIHHAHLIRTCDIYVGENTSMSSLSDALERQKKADLRIRLSTSCPPGSDPLFTQCAHCLLPLASCQTRRALSSTGATCSEENTSDIDKNCLFFPPASLLIRAPCFYTSHPAAARRDVLAGRGVFALHQVDLPAESSLAFLLHKSCLKTRLTESTRAGS